ANNTREEHFYKLEVNVASLPKDVGSISLSVRKLESITGLLMEKLDVVNEELGSHEEDTHEYEEEKPHIISTHPPFKEEVKIEIQPYDGEVNAENINHWLAQLK
ncbi:hypothetical protein KI387_026716, partial [Taxus chinensis]